MGRVQAVTNGNSTSVLLSPGLKPAQHHLLWKLRLRAHLVPTAQLGPLGYLSTTILNQSECVHSLRCHKVTYLSPYSASASVCARQNLLLGESALVSSLQVQWVAPHQTYTCFLA